MKTKDDTTYLLMLKHFNVLMERINEIEEYYFQLKKDIDNIKEMMRENECAL